MLAVLEMLEKNDKKIFINGKKEGKKEGMKKGMIYNIPINVDTIEKGYPILCA